MKIEDTFIPGLKLIYLDKHKDHRGSFLKVFNTSLFKEQGLSINFCESYYTVSKKNVIRGMHFQAPPFEHIKCVYLNKGVIKDVVLDIRRESPTYGKYLSIILTEEEPIVIYIPKGCAHGFCSLQDDSMITYFQTSDHNALGDSGIKWDSFGMNWEVNNPLISERDQTLIFFSKFNSPF